MVNDFISNKHAKTPSGDKEMFDIRKTIIMRHVAWKTSLRHALRQHKPWEGSRLDKADLEYMSRIKAKEWHCNLEEELNGYVSDAEKQASRMSKSTI